MARGKRKFNCNKWMRQMSLSCKIFRKRILGFFLENCRGCPCPKKSQSVHTDETHKSFRSIWVGGCTPTCMPLTAAEQDVLDSYSSNAVRSTRYHWWNFLPKNLFEQFMRIANFYFLVIVIIQIVIPDSSIPIFISWMPLVFVLSVTLVKQGYEDFKRFVEDRKLNSEKVLIFRPGIEENEEDKFVVDVAENICVGDVVKLSNKRVAPCDFVILASSSPDGEGSCFVNTASLDGETNLKVMMTPRSLLNIWNQPNMFIKIVAAPPCEDLYNFVGTAEVYESYERLTAADTEYAYTWVKKDVVPLTAKNIFLREMRLIDTDWVIGCTVYTGIDTRIARNSQKKRLKRSSVEQRMNPFILIYFLLIMVLALILTCAFYITEIVSGVSKAARWYIPLIKGSTYDVFATFFTFFILLHTMIPISLYVTIEMFKFCSLVFFNYDQLMYYEPHNLPARANTSDLNEELGQVEYLFCDKTGTLTENEMVFRKLATSQGEVYRFHKHALTKETVVWNPDMPKEQSDTREKTVNKKNLLNTNAKQNNSRKRKSQKPKRLSSSSIFSETSNQKKQEQSEVESHTESSPKPSITDDTDVIIKTTPKKNELMPNRGQLLYPPITSSILLTTTAIVHIDNATKSETTTERNVLSFSENGEDVMINDNLLQVSTLPTAYCDTLQKKVDLSSIVTAEQSPSFKAVFGDSSENSRFNNMSETETTTMTSETSLNKMLICMVLCHTVRFDEAKNCYEATSSDEKAFVEACRSVGIVYLGQREYVDYVDYRGTELKYRRHYTLEFDSDRKMSTVLMEDLNKHTYHCFCKGADISIFSRVKADTDIGKLSDIVNQFATAGLRVIVFAERKVSKYVFKSMCTQLRNAEVSLDREIEQQKAFAVVERELRLLGCTGVEDRLQDGVQDAMKDLLQAGIKIWILTGDTMKTAINISQACGHSHKETSMMTLVELSTLKDTRRQLLKLLTQTNLLQERFSSTSINSLSMNSNNIFSKFPMSNSNATQNLLRREMLVVDGKTLGIITSGGSEVISLFMGLLLMCDRVLCCRMSPLQKASIVRMVRLNMKTVGRKSAITAAVGDGANDVSMILEAHVGFGLYGKEGMQAVLSADFRLARFTYLRHAILFHGYNYYYRLAILVLFFFYKNLLMGLGHVVIAFVNRSSGQSSYPSAYVMLYNTVFTSLVIFVYSLMDLAISRTEILSNPELYAKLRGNALLTWVKFCKWNALAVWHAFVVFGGSLIFLGGNEVMGRNGHTFDLYCWGTISMFTVVMVVHVRIFLETHTFNWPMAVSYLLTFLSSLMCIAVSNIMRFSDLLPYHWVSLVVAQHPQSWFQVVFLIFTCIFPEFAIRGAWDIYKRLTHTYTVNTSTSNNNPMTPTGKCPNSPYSQSVSLYESPDVSPSRTK